MHGSEPAAGGSDPSADRNLGGFLALKGPAKISNKLSMMFSNRESDWP